MRKERKSQEGKRTSEEVKKAEDEAAGEQWRRCLESKARTK